MSLNLYIPQHVPSEYLKAALCHIADMPYVLKRIDVENDEVTQAIQKIEIMLANLNNQSPKQFKEDKGLDERQPSSMSNPWEKCYISKRASDEAETVLFDKGSWGNNPQNALKLDFVRISAESGWRRGFVANLHEYSSDHFSIGHKMLSFGQEFGDCLLIARTLAKYFGGKIVYDDCGLKDFEEPDESYPAGSFCPLMKNENPLEWRFKVINQINTIPLLDMSCLPELPENRGVSEDFMKYLMKRQQYLDSLALNKDLLDRVKKPKATPSLKPETFRF